MKTARLALRAVHRWLDNQHPEPHIISIDVRDQGSYTREAGFVADWQAQVQVYGERNAAAWTMASRENGIIHWHLDVAPGVRLLLVELDTESPSPSALQVLP